MYLRPMCVNGELLRQLRCVTAMTSCGVELARCVPNCRWQMPRKLVESRKEKEEVRGSDGEHGGIMMVGHVKTENQCYIIGILNELLIRADTHTQNIIFVVQCIKITYDSVEYHKLILGPYSVKARSARRMIHKCDNQAYTSPNTTANMIDNELLCNLPAGCPVSFSFYIILPFCHSPVRCDHGR